MMHRWIDIIKTWLFLMLIIGVLNSRSLSNEIDKKTQNVYRIILGLNESHILEYFTKIQAVELRTYLNRENIMYKKFDIESNGRIYFILLNKDNIKDVKEMLDNIYKNYPGYTLINKQASFYLSFGNELIPFIKMNAIGDAIKIIRNRLEEFGLSEEVKRKSKAEIIVDLHLDRGETEVEKKRIDNLIINQGNLMLMEVLNKTTTGETASTKDNMLVRVYKNRRSYSLRTIPIVVVSKAKDADVGFRSNNEVIITFSLNKHDMQIVSKFTSKNIGKKLAIVFDGKVLGIMPINKRLSSDWKGHLSNNFSLREAHDLAIILRSGAMLAPLYYIYKNNRIESSIGNKEANRCKSKKFIYLKLSASDFFQKDNYIESFKLFKKAHHLCPSDKDVESIIKDLKNLLKGEQ